MMCEKISVSENLGLVHACAGRFRCKGIDYDDLFQTGCVGLVKAAENFDPKLGYQFSTYAVPVIMGEIKRLFRDGGSVKVSRSLKELSLKISREINLFVSQNGCEPTISELSQRMNLPTEEIAEAISSNAAPLSMTFYDEDGESQTDIPVEAPEEKLTEILSLHHEIRNLSQQDRNIIFFRFYQNITQSETAKKLNMTQVQVSRREKKILLFLRSRLSSL